jgi:hypothetical protein
MQLSSCSPLAAVALPHLIALKLHAGGDGSKRDVIELLQRNEENGTLNIEAVRHVCQRFMLGSKLDGILKDMGFQ